VGKGVEEMYLGVRRRILKISRHALNWGAQQTGGPFVKRSRQMCRWKGNSEIRKIVKYSHICSA